jgi:hypothetical protein
MTSTDTDRLHGLITALICAAPLFWLVIRADRRNR